MSEEPKLTNPRHKAFADYYLDHKFHTTEAYAHAYGKDLSNKSEYDYCSASGSRLIRNDKVKAYINWHMEQRALTKNDMLDFMRDVMTFDITKYLNDDMSLNLKQIKADGVGAIIEDIDIAETRNAKGQLERKLSAKFMKKAAVMKDVLKVIGAYEKDNAQKADHTHTIKGYAIISPDDWDNDKTD